jgi:hypothetical protein
MSEDLPDLPELNEIETAPVGYRSEIMAMVGLTYDGEPLPESESDEPTQKTPKNHEIPIPKKSDWERNLEKVTKAPAKQAKK